MSSIFRKVPAFILIAAICILQYGCSISHNPSDSVLKKALQLQIQLTDQTLAGLLGTEKIVKEIIRVKVDQSSYMDYPNEKILSVMGHFNYQLKDPKDIHKTSFNLFLKKGAKGQSWNLLNPTISSVDGDFDWIVYQLPIDT